MPFQLPSLLPAYLVVPVALAYIGLYQLTAPYFATEKQRAYLLSGCTSALMSAMSLPWLWVYASRGFQGLYDVEPWMRVQAEVGVTVFLVYLLLDLGWGWLKYPKQIGVLTGWVHHTVYAFLMIYLLFTPHSPIFLTGAAMEIPTFDLAASTLWPKLRNDVRFLSSFFIFRIAYHIVLLADTLRPSSLQVASFAVTPPLMLSLALILHVSWFRGGVIGHLKRVKAKAEKRRLSAAEKAQMDEPILEAAAKLDPTVVDSTLAQTPAFGPTPDDSPLVTPYSGALAPVTPTSLRDSFISLPNLGKNFQGMAHLPTLSIPTIPSLAEVSHRLDRSGFKDAVKHRWDEQRGKFGEMGKGMGLTFGLRRRAGSDGSEDDALISVHEVSVH